MERKSFFSVCCGGFGDLGNGARQFHAGWPRTNDDEGQPGAALLRIQDALGYFECLQNFVPGCDRFFNALETRGPFLPLVVPEIGRLRAGGDNQGIVWENGPVGQVDAF